MLLSEGTGVADIIRALGVAEATVRSQIARALNSLRIATTETRVHRDVVTLESR